MQGGHVHTNAIPGNGCVKVHTTNAVPVCMCVWKGGGGGGVEDDDKFMMWKKMLISVMIVLMVVVIAMMMMMTILPFQRANFIQEV